MDEDGYVAITGRHKDMIIRGGENIYPKESKNFYYGMDGVRDVQVVGVPSANVRGRSMRFCHPQGWLFLHAPGRDRFLPRQDIPLQNPEVRCLRGRISHDASGKIQKFKLRETAAELFP